MLILNILAAVAFLFLGGFATAAHRTHAYSMYRELKFNHALVEKPTYADGTPMDVEARFLPRIELELRAWKYAEEELAKTRHNSKKPYLSG